MSDKQNCFISTSYHVPKHKKKPILLKKVLEVPILNKFLLMQEKRSSYWGTLISMSLHVHAIAEI